ARRAAHAVLAWRSLRALLRPVVSPPRRVQPGQFATAPHGQAITTTHSEHIGVARRARRRAPRITRLWPVLRAGPPTAPDLARQSPAPPQPGERRSEPRPRLSGRATAPARCLRAPA